MGKLSGDVWRRKECGVRSERSEEEGLEAVKEMTNWITAGLYGLQ